MGGSMYIVSTVNTQVSRVTDSGLLSDIVLLTTDQAKANRVAAALKDRRVIIGLDYSPPLYMWVRNSN